MFESNKLKRFVISYFDPSFLINLLLCSVLFKVVTVRLEATDCNCDSSPSTSDKNKIEEVAGKEDTNEKKTEAEDDIFKKIFSFFILV